MTSTYLGRVVRFLSYILLWFALPFAVTCSSSSSGSPFGLPVPSDILELATTLAFGDAPVAGELRIRAATALTGWTYTVDLEGDGAIEESGGLHWGVSVPYSFSTMGVHRIVVVLERRGETHRSEHLVVVNDATAVGLEDAVDLGASVEPDAMALDEEHDRLFVVDTRNFVLFNLRLNDLLPRWNIQLPGVEFPDGGWIPTQGVVLSGDSLYIDIGDSLITVDAARQLVLENLADAHWGQFILRRSDGRLYIGGFAGIGVVDPGTGSTTRSLARENFDGGHFSLSPNEEILAFLSFDPEYTLHFLDAETLVEIRSVALGDIGFPFAVAFHPQGDRVYVFSEGNAWHMMVVEVASARIVKDIVIARGPVFFLSGLMPVAPSHDGRFVVLPTPLGTFFIDTTIDHPRYRSIESDPNESYGCCSVVPSVRGPVFYLADEASGTVKALRLLR